MQPKITLEGLLSVIKSVKPITVNLVNEEGLEIITFMLPGYKALDDFLEDDEVLEIDLINLGNIKVKIDTTLNN